MRTRWAPPFPRLARSLTRLGTNGSIRPHDFRDAASATTRGNRVARSRSVGGLPVTRAVAGGSMEACHSTAEGMPAPPVDRVALFSDVSPDVRLRPAVVEFKRAATETPSRCSSSGSSASNRPTGRGADQSSRSVGPCSSRLIALSTSLPQTSQPGAASRATSSTRGTSPHSATIRSRTSADFALCRPTGASTTECTARDARRPPPRREQADLGVLPRPVPQPPEPAARPAVALDPGEGDRLEGDAPGLDHAQRLGQQRERRPQEQHGVAGRQLADGQAADRIEGQARVVPLRGTPLAAGGVGLEPPRWVGVDDGIATHAPRLTRRRRGSQGPPVRPHCVSSTVRRNAHCGAHRRRSDWRRNTHLVDRSSRCSAGKR